MWLGIQEDETVVKLRCNLNSVWFQAPRNLLPVVHLPIQDSKIHPVAAVQVDAYRGHRALRFAALPGDLHLCLPGMTGVGDDRGAAHNVLDVSSGACG